MSGKGAVPRAELTILQRSLAAIGAIRSLRHVQDALQTIPVFIPADILISAGIAAGLCTPPVAVEALGSFSAAELDALLLQCTFSDNRILTFPEFLSLTREVKRLYSQRQATNSAPDALCDEAEYVVTVLNSEAGDAAASTTTAEVRTNLVAQDRNLLDPASPVIDAGAPIMGASPTDRLRLERHDALAKYLQWFGVHSAAEELEDALDDAFQHSLLGDGGPSDKDPWDNNRIETGRMKGHAHRIGQLHGGGGDGGGVLSDRSRFRSRALSLRGSIGMPRQRRSLQPCSSTTEHSEVAARGSVAAQSSSRATSGGAGGAAAGHYSPIQGGGSITTAGWLSPVFSEKGHGPRGSFYTFDIPPNQSEKDAHLARMVEASVRRSAKMKQRVDLLGDLRDTRSISERLRLPALRAEEIRGIRDETTFRWSEHQVELQSRDAEVAGKLAALAVDRAARAEAVAHRPKTSFELNRIIDQTYRRAGDLGISTTNAAATVERRLAKRQEAERLAARKKREAERCSGFRV